MDKDYTKFTKALKSSYYGSETTVLLTSMLSGRACRFTPLQDKLRVQSINNDALTVDTDIIVYEINDE